MTTSFFFLLVLTCGAPIQKKDWEDVVSEKGLQTGNRYAEPALGLEKLLGPSFSSTAHFFTPLIHKPGI